jgi:hypothetical protein
MVALNKTLESEVIHMTTARDLLMVSDIAMVSIPQAFDGVATVEDTMDAEYPWLDAKAEIVGYKYRKGTTIPEAVIIKVEYDFTLQEVAVAE